LYYFLGLLPPEADCALVTNQTLRCSLKSLSFLPLVGGNCREFRKGEI